MIHPSPRTVVTYWSRELFRTNNRVLDSMDRKVPEELEQIVLDLIPENDSLELIIDYEAVIEQSCQGRDTPPVDIVNRFLIKAWLDAAPEKRLSAELAEVCWKWWWNDIDVAEIR